MSPRIYSINSNTGRILKSGNEWTSIGTTLYLFHTSKNGYHRRIMSDACAKGFSSVRCVLMFEGITSVENILQDDKPWEAVESVLKLGVEMDMAVTVEVVSALLTWIDRKNENPYSEEFDELFDYVIRRSVSQFSEYSSLFLVTILNEVLPYRSAGFQSDQMFRRLLKSADLYKTLAPTLLIGSGGLLHMGIKSGGIVSFVKVPWLENPVPYWEAVYTAPNIDICMLHIYSTVEKITNNNSEWSNVKDYTRFCRINKRAFIVDEFGLKLSYVKYPEDKTIAVNEANVFLKAIGNVLTNLQSTENNIDDLPSMLQYWNLSINAQGYDWYPTYTPEVFDTFEEIFEDDIGYQMMSKKTRKYSFNPWRKSNAIILQQVFSKEYEYDSNFKTEKILSVSVANVKNVKQVCAEIFVDPKVNIPNNILFRFNLKIRDLDTGRLLYRQQDFSSWRQNQIVPVVDTDNIKQKQYIFARLNQDFNENLFGDNFEIEWVDVVLTKFVTPFSTRGSFQIRDLKLLIY